MRLDLMLTMASDGQLQCEYGSSSHRQLLEPIQQALEREGLTTQVANVSTEVLLRLGPPGLDGGWLWQDQLFVWTREQVRIQILILQRNRFFTSLLIPLAHHVPLE
ncbi:MAG TPA: hypothetical protein VFZ09_17360 [Archangium sp.]|nr:hypothetical protein [Archangium sp.]HEX5748013.1 hypothetical protein [Archangium sp.]